MSGAAASASAPVGRSPDASPVGQAPNRRTYRRCQGSPPRAGRSAGVRTPRPPPAVHRPAPPDRPARYPYGPGRRRTRARPGRRPPGPRRPAAPPPPPPGHRAAGSRATAASGTPRGPRAAPCRGDTRRTWGQCRPGAGGGAPGRVPAARRAAAVHRGRPGPRTRSLPYARRTSDVPPPHRNHVNRPGGGGQVDAPCRPRAILSNGALNCPCFYRLCSAVGRTFGTYAIRVRSLDRPHRCS